MIRPLSALLLAATAAVTAQQSANNPIWIGVWQGLLDGQPSVTLTLAQDAGELDGTIVLYIISRDGERPHIVAREPQVLMHSRCAQKTLSFQVKRIDGSADLMDFTVKLASSGTANIHCENCGVDAPVVEIEKMP